MQIVDPQPWNKTCAPAFIASLSICVERVARDTVTGDITGASIHFYFASMVTITSHFHIFLLSSLYLSMQMCVCLADNMVRLHVDSSLI
jgi:hypothetical protein